MSCTILGLGTALPEHAIAQGDAADLARTFCCQNDKRLRLLPALYRRTGVRRRSSVLLEDSNGTHVGHSFYRPSTGSSDYGPTTRERMDRYARAAPALATCAARRALKESGYRPDEMTHLITVSCSGFSAPGVDVKLIKALGLRPIVERTHIGFMGCHGAINGLRVVCALTGADPAARVLLCAVELCSLHMRYGWDPDRVVANALFADGAAAVVAASSLGGARNGWNVKATGSCLIPDSSDAMSWDIGDHGFEMSLSPRVPDLIAEHLRPWIEQWLARQGLCMRSVGSWAIHPGGPRILSAAERALELAPDATEVSREVLAECGNMSSPTVLFILERLRNRDALRPCIALAFGPGLVVEAVLLA